MSITVYCKVCGKKMRVPEQSAGRIGKCSRCAAPVKVPAQSETSPPEYLSNREDSGGHPEDAPTPAEALEAVAESRPIASKIEAPAPKAESTSQSRPRTKPETKTEPLPVSKATAETSSDEGLQEKRAQGKSRMEELRKRAEARKADRARQVTLDPEINAGETAEHSDAAFETAPHEEREVAPAQLEGSVVPAGTGSPKAKVPGSGAEQPRPKAAPKIALDLESVQKPGTGPKVQALDAPDEIKWDVRTESSEQSGLIWVALVVILVLGLGTYGMYLLQAEPQPQQGPRREREKQAPSEDEPVTDDSMQRLRDGQPLYDRERLQRPQVSPYLPGNEPHSGDE